MTADDVIQSYVTDVALKLPRASRNDVAFELRALLHEALQAKAGDAGRPADEAMAIEVLQSFGPPSAVAARYSPTLTIIDPADGPRFLRWTIVGLVIIWVLGLVSNLTQPITSGSDLLRALGHWWVATVIPSPWWPGVLVVGFGASAWKRRRSVQPPSWRPRSADSIRGGRGAIALGLLYTLSGLIVLLGRRWLLEVLSGGRAAPAAYDAITFTDGFLHRQAPVALALMLLHVAMLIGALVSGRWTALLRRIELVANLAWCAVLGWIILDGPVVVAPGGDRVVKPILALLIVVSLFDVGLKAYRRVRPRPALQGQTQGRVSG